MRACVAGVALSCLLLLTGVAAGAASFSDTVGDDNASPDITSVSISEAGDLVTVRVQVANYQSLPGRSWFNIWFDLDQNPQTGDGAGDEMLVRYVDTGAIEHYAWTGTDWAEAPAPGVTGSFNAGAMSLVLPKTFLGSSSFGVLAVGARGQLLTGELLVASDFAPASGRFAYTSPTPVTYPDPAGDHAAAPDIAQVRVTDGKDGWIRFDIQTPNRRTLPPSSLVIVSIDADNRANTGGAGAEATLSTLGGEIRLQRWSRARRDWVDDDPPSRIRLRSRANHVVLDIHRSELGNPAGFGFKVTSIDLETLTGMFMAVDFAPNNGAFWRYRMTNQPALRLVAGRAVGKPVRPRSGSRFTVSVPVRRSDTNRAIASGRVTCNVTVAGKRVRAAGRVRAGRAECALRVPATGSPVRGSLTVRSAGAAVTSRFSFRVR